MIRQLLLSAFLAFAAYKIHIYIDWLDVYQELYNHRPGKCHKLDGTEHGSEDVVVLPNGWVFISSGIIGRDNEKYRSRVGKIFLFDFNNPDKPPQRLRIIDKDGKDFCLVSPVSVGTWTDESSGQIYLYVGRYIKYDMTVEKFSFDATDRTLTHVRQIPQQPEFHMLDNFVVVGEDQFYYTNWVYSIDLLEMFLGTRWGSIGFFDGTKATLIKTGLVTPNGIGISPDGKFLYVVCTCTGELLVYRRDRDNNLSITFDKAINLRTSPDNLVVDAKTGDVWVGAHPLLHKIVWYLDDPTLTSPSQVIRVKMSDGKAIAIDEIYSDDGTQISASSVAAVYGSGLVIGSLGSHALYCSMDSEYAKPPAFVPLETS